MYILPEPSDVWKAIEAYMRCAYGELNPPVAVQKRLETLRAAGENRDAFYFTSGVFERVSRKFKLRLGNWFYPHMKLSIDWRPDDAGFFYRADTHDRHIRPSPASKDYAAFLELMEKNQKLAQDIEASWENGGLPTFKIYLKQDLQRRRQNGR